MKYSIKMLAALLILHSVISGGGLIYYCWLTTKPADQQHHKVTPATNSVQLAPSIQLASNKFLLPSASENKNEILFLLPSVSESKNQILNEWQLNIPLPAVLYIAFGYLSLAISAVWMLIGKLSSSN